MLAAVEAAELDGVLSNPSAEFTVFAPIDDAFEGVDLDELLSDVDVLTDILTYHVVAGVFESGDLTDGQVIKTLEGTEITININNGDVFIIDEEGNQAQVKTPDVQASNGVVHIIDAVLLRTPTATSDDAPPAEETTSETGPEATTTDDVGAGDAPVAFTVLGGLPVGGAPAVALGAADTGAAGAAVEEVVDDEVEDGETLGDATTVGDDEENGNGEVAGAVDEADEAGWLNWAWVVFAVAAAATLWLLAAARRRREEE